MKYFWLLFLLSNAVAAAQNEIYSETEVNPYKEEFLLDFENAVHGGFGAPVLKITSIQGAPAIMIGGRGAWIINHEFALGAGVYTSVFSDVETEYIDPATGKCPMFNLTNIGLEFEYSHNPMKSIHFNFLLFFGAGSISFFSNYDSDLSNTTQNSDVPDYGVDWFFVFEPQISAEINLLKWMRIAVYGGYRLADGVNYIFKNDGQSFTNSDVTGPVASLTFKFGKF